MACRRRRRRPMSEINVVPYIDVMLVMLVIFMVTTPLMTQGVKVALPQAAARPVDTANREPLEVTVDRAGRFYLNIGGEPDRPIDAGLLVQRTAAILRHRPGTPVFVRGDREVDYGRVVEAMVLLQQAGAQSVGLLTRPPAGGH